MDLVNRYKAEHDLHWQVMLTCARAVTARRAKARSTDDPPIQRCTIVELLGMNDCPDEATQALLHLLDSVEEIGVGVRMGVLDKHLIYQALRTRLVQVVNTGAPCIAQIRKGRLSHRDASFSAYTNAEWLASELEALDPRPPDKLDGALPDLQDDSPGGRSKVKDIIRILLSKPDRSR